ncbi:MAG: serine/threonine protein kinase [Pyrinomonadaceae bacterium]|nr:serine/threonine protein kinase [Pyrinomonadaceae bacterium]
MRNRCGDDLSLRREVEKLLSNLENAPDFMEISAVNSALTLLDEDNAETLIGQKIGAYRLLKLVGQGGMGTVYLASRVDEAFRKEVAVKIVPPFLHNIETEKSFRRERQILAKLEHPNIARLIDGGTTRGNIPYLVMEFVEGKAITEFCIASKLSIRERLRLFLKVCEAVKFAHQNLIIHRDLKPNNIFVTNDGTVKLLDFGVAKLLRPELFDVTGNFSFGANVLTPNYASPEQLRDENITTASDVYSLAVILYELLTENRPHDLKQKSLPEILRIISEEKPLNPSKHETSIDSDLDTICCKALSKEVAERYQTVDELSADILRYLNDLPILARQPSTFYRLRKYIVRNKLAVAIACLIATISFGWLATAILQRNAARRQAAQNLELAYSADMNLAAFSWKTANLTRLQELLERYEPKNVDGVDLRGFEWRFLHHLSHPKGKVLTVKHDKDVWSTAFSPDGAKFATGCADGFARIYETSSGKLLAVTQVQEKNVWRVKFTPDGKFIGTASGDSNSTSAKIWNVETGAEVLSLIGHEDRVRAIDFSPNGKLVATGSRDETVKIWNLADGKLLKNISIKNNYRFETHDLTFSPDGKKIALVNDALFVFDVASGRELLKIQEVMTSHALAFAPNGKTICVGRNNGDLFLFDSESGKKLWQKSAHKSKINDVEFSIDGETIATASSDRAVRFFQANDAADVQTLKAHSSDAWSISFSPKCDFIITSSTDFQTHLWRQSELLQRDTIAYSSTTTSDLAAISRDGKILALNASGSLNGVSVWDLATRRMLFSVATGVSEIDAMAFAPSCKTLAIGGKNGDFILINSANGAEIKRFKPHEKRLRGIAFAPDGETFLTASDDNTARLWRTTDFAEIHRFEHKAFIGAIGFVNDGKSIFVSSYDYTANLWNAQTFDKIAEINGHSKPILSFANAPTEKIFATGGADGLIKTWNAENGEPLQDLSGNAGHVTALAFAPNGKRLASAGTEGVIRLWKLDAINAVNNAPQQVLGFDAPSSTTNFIYFTPDENLLVTSGIYEKTHLWLATPPEEIKGK